MSQAKNRNARCHCGSGKKFKNCHGEDVGTNNARKFPTGLILGGLALLGALGLVYMTQTGGQSQPGNAPPGKVWSPEHRHWHDAP